MMRTIGPWLARWRIGRKLDWMRFTYARLRTPGRIIAADVPYIDPPFTLRMSPGSTLVLGRNVHFRPGFVANITGDARLEIGDDVAFNVNCWIGVTTSIRIGNACLVGPFVSFTDGNHRFDQPGELVWNQGLDLRPLEIGRNVWFGAKATVISSVGDDCVVGANAVVTKPIPPRSVAVGVPARVQRTLGEIPPATDVALRSSPG